MFKIAAIAGFVFLGGESLRAEDAAVPPVVPIELNDPLPYGQQPMDYHGQATRNAVQKLQQRLDRGELELSAQSPQGYLQSVLAELKISPTSQMLVFSKTALNPKLVSPKTPRAVYFNEESYVGWVPEAAALEIAAVDPRKGWMFYTLTQPDFHPGEMAESVPRFKRESQCLACHAGQSTLRMPGGLVRAFVTDETGKPLSGYSRITHETAFEKRFGGWYVTGTHGKQTHRGNRIESKAGPADQLFPTPNNIKELSQVLEGSNYLTFHSDLVAQLVLHHQIHGQNLLIRVGYESRFGKHSEAEDLLVRYLLFADEAPLSEPVRGSTGFAAWFQKRGRQDSQGRSLRDWDLNTRLFKYRLSYLIDTPLFNGLPAGTKQRIYEKLWEVLSAKQPSPPFPPIPAEERQAILEIVAPLKDDLPPQWANLTKNPGPSDSKPTQNVKPARKTSEDVEF